MDMDIRFLSKMRGQSLSELFILTIVFVPAFLTIPLIGKYGEVKQKNLESSRYAVWERSVWSDRQGSWNEDENNKDDGRIFREVDTRVIGNSRQPIKSHRETQSDNLFLVNHKGEKILRQTYVGTDGNKYRAYTSVTESRPRAGTAFVDLYAYKGVPVLRQMGKAVNGVGKVLGVVAGSCRNIPGIDFDKGMNLGSRNFAQATVKTRAANYTVGTGDLEFVSKAALLTNAWAAPGKNGQFPHFNKRVNALVGQELVACTAWPGTNTFGLLSTGAYDWWFGEMRHGDNTELMADVNVILPEYKR